MNRFGQFAAPLAALALGIGMVGCSSEPKAEQVPPNARLLVQGDKTLNYAAPQDGDVYVYDSNDSTLIYSGHVEKGQSISIDPEDDKVMIDNKLAVEKDIHAGNVHRIYFVPDRHDDDHGRVHKTTEVRDHAADGHREGDSGTTIKREETKKIDANPDGDVTIKKETTIKTE